VDFILFNMRVAVVGHVEWIDFVPVERFPVQGEVIPAQGAFSRAGGAGGVVAKVLSALGAEVDFYTALGRDPHGESANAELAEWGVKTQVAWRDEPTRRAVVLLVGGGERTIVTIGSRLHPDGDDDLDWPRLEHADGAYFTAGDAEALARARAARVLTATPRGRGALDTDGPKLDALIFSELDEDESAWAERLEQRTRLLVATKGDEGGRWWGESSGTWEACAPPGPVLDAYGAGDSFAAGFTYALAAGKPVSEAAKLGSECGARALTHQGVP
jgi:ribokinase